MFSNMKGICRVFLTSFVVLLATQSMAASYIQAKGQSMQPQNSFHQGKHGGQALQRVNSLKRQANETQYVTVEQFNSEMAEVREDINTLVSIVNQVSTEVSSLNNAIGSQDGRISAIESQQQEERKTPPLFFARFNGVTTNYNGEIYKFTDVVVNTGGGSYSQDNGKYTCGKEGYYLVGVMLFGQDLALGGNYVVYGELYKGDYWLTTLVGDNYMNSGPGENDDLQASSTVIVHCMQGEVIYVKGRSGGSGGVRSDRGDFTVMFVHA